MRRLWNVSLTISEDWGGLAAITTQRFEVLADSPEDAELVITDHLIREHRAATPDTHFDVREVTIGPALCDMNAIRDGLIPPIRLIE